MPLDAEQLLRRLVIAWDADQDEEFADLIAEARAQMGFKLADEDGGDDDTEAGR